MKITILSKEEACKLYDSITEQWKMGFVVECSEDQQGKYGPYKTVEKAEKMVHFLRYEDPLAEGRVREVNVNRIFMNLIAENAWTGAYQVFLCGSEDDYTHDYYIYDDLKEAISEGFLKIKTNLEYIKFYVVSVQVNKYKSLRLLNCCSEVVFRSD